MPYSNKTVLVYDNGIFLNFAERLADFFGKVLYFNQWKSAAPRTNVHDIGCGVDKITKIYNFWDHIDEVDLFVFPDVYDGDLQVYLESIGKRVWGSRKGEELELERWKTHQLLNSLGEPTTPTLRIKGIERLKQILKQTEDKYVKISTVRGDTETFHHSKWPTTRDKIREIEYRMGAKSLTAEFLVESPIKDAVEIGYDGWCVDGEFPSICVQGYEVKDVGYIGVVKPYKDIAKQLREKNSVLSDIFKQYGYRGFYSSEVRVQKNRSFLLDPCCRLGSPPSEVYQMLYKNLGEIIWEGAEGNLVTPKPAGNYGVQAIIVAQWAAKNWQTIQFPKELAPFIKLKNYTTIKGDLSVMPQESELAEIGSVVAIGDTLEEAVCKCKCYAEQVDGFGFSVKLDALRSAGKYIQEGEDMGVPVAAAKKRYR